MRSLQAEEARIHEAYERRANTDARYSWFDYGHLFTMQQLELRILRALRVHGIEPLHSRRILEIGCGNGHWLRQFIQWGARPEHLTGVDVLEARVDEARRLCPSQVRIDRANAAALNFPNGSFDLVFQATVFTSVLHPDFKRQLAAEMMRVTGDRGFILWYDFRFDNPWNPDVRGVKCSEIRKLFPGCNLWLRRMTLAPPLARRLAPYSWLGCSLLEKIPWLCTHYLGVIQKQAVPTAVRP
jgi:ubiquinone/menaquinone biosynthesis C-methylase UbiE